MLTLFNPSAGDFIAVTLTLNYLQSTREKFSQQGELEIVDSPMEICISLKSWHQQFTLLFDMLQKAVE